MGEKSKPIRLTLNETDIESLKSMGAALVEDRLVVAQSPEGVSQKTHEKHMARVLHGFNNVMTKIMIADLRRSLD